VRETGKPLGSPSSEAERAVPAAAGRAQLQHVLLQLDWLLFARELTPRTPASQRTERRLIALGGANGWD